MKKCLHLLLFTVIVITGCSSGNKEEQVQITVSAAASLSDVLEDITVDFEKKHLDIKVRFNFGASGALKEQIEQGAPVDVFVSASTDKFAELVAGDLAKEGMNIIRNNLVLIAPVGEEDMQTFQDLSNDTIEKIALGTPDVVPAGQFGRQVLAYYDVWSTIESKIVYAKDVRQVLTYVETKNVQAGIVYKTDAITSDKVRIVQTAEVGSHDSIVYPAGIVSSTKLENDAQLFLDYLVAENVQSIWEQYGFQME